MVVMKGREFHGGVNHRLLTDGVPGTPSTADGLPELFTAETNVWRLGFICYPSMAIYRRSTSTFMFPPCRFGCSVQVPRAPSGLSPYIVGGGERLFRSREEMLQHCIREVLMEASNKLADLGVDSASVRSLSSFRDLASGDREVSVRLPPPTCKDSSLHRLLQWHVRTSEIFLLKGTVIEPPIEPESGSEAPNPGQPTDIEAVIRRFQLDSHSDPPPERPEAVREIVSVSCPDPSQVSVTAAERPRSTHSSVPRQDPVYEVLLEGGRLATVTGHSQ